MYRVPYAGPALHALVDSFDLRTFDPVGALADRSTRRFLAGHRVSPKARAAAVRAVAAALNNAGILPPIDERALLPPGAIELLRSRDDFAAVDPVNVLSGVLLHAVERWDQLAGALRTRTAPIAHPRHMTAACLRLVTIDLSVRLAALNWLGCGDAARPVSIEWARPGGLGPWLRETVKNVRPDLTRDALAKAAKVTRNTVDGWLDRGVRPIDDNLQDLAAVLSAEDPELFDATLATLRVMYGARALFERVEAAVGAEDALEMAQRLVAWSGYMIEFPKRSQHREEQTFLMWSCVGLGVGLPGQPLPWVAHMLKGAQRKEADPAWATALRGVFRPWLDSLQRIARSLGPSLERELLSAFGDGVELPPSVREQFIRLAICDPAVLYDLPGFAQLHTAFAAQGGRAGRSVFKTQALMAEERGDRLAAIDLFQRAVNCDPTNAECHFRLGASLGELGDIKRALPELEIAVQLAPDWSPAIEEIAVVLLNDERPAEALARLRAVADRFADTRTFLFIYALALERCHEHEEARDVLIRLLELAPEHAEAHDEIAHVYLLLGDRRAARRHAKEAAHLGLGTVLGALEAGHYSGQGPWSRPPHALDLAEFVRSTGRPWKVQRSAEDDEGT